MKVFIEGTPEEIAVLLDTAKAQAFDFHIDVKPISDSLPEYSGNTISEKIRCLCKENGTSIYALERELGIGNGTISKWGRTRRSPRVETLKRVADHFGVTVDELLEGGENTQAQ